MGIEKDILVKVGSVLFWYTGGSVLFIIPMILFSVFYLKFNPLQRNILKEACKRMGLIKTLFLLIVSQNQSFCFHEYIRDLEEETQKANLRKFWITYLSIYWNGFIWSIEIVLGNIVFSGVIVWWYFDLISIYLSGGDPSVGIITGPVALFLCGCISIAMWIVLRFVVWRIVYSKLKKKF
jgi:hypothetical protein